MNEKSETTQPVSVPPLYWMQSFLGGVLSFPMTPEMVDLEDIAHSLSLLCRYNGHCRTFYSVAEHSILLSHWIEETYGDRNLALRALLHDGTEAYTGDLPTPLKPFCPGFLELEAQAETAIAAAFFLGTHVLDSEGRIKTADRRIVEDEATLLLGPPPFPWTFHPEGPLNVKIECLQPDEAKATFLARFKELVP